MAMKVISFFNQAIYGKGVTPPPGSVVSLTFLLMIFDALTITVTLPLLPKMMLKFGSPEKDVGYYVGTSTSIMWAVCLVFSLVWGYLGDTYGRKRICIMSGSGLATATLLFGFSSSIPYTVIMRSLQGFFMGNVVTTKAILASVCNDSNMVGAISLIVSSFSIGRIVGPAFGGFLAFPGERYPTAFPSGSLFSKYSVLLPYLIVSVLLFIFLTLNWIFLPNDSVLSGSEKDGHVAKNKNVIEPDDNNSYLPNEKQTSKDSPYMKLQEDEDFSSTKQDLTLIDKMKSSRLYNVIRRKECLVCCLLYASFSFLDIGFGVMFPLIASTDKSLGGMALKPNQIGELQTAEGILLTLLQITVIPRMIKYLRPIRTLIVSNIAFAVLFPFLCWICGRSALQYNVQWFCVLFTITLMSSSAFTGVVSIIVLFNNSFESNLLSIVNGVSVTSACMGRMISPVVAGSIFSWSLKNIGILTFPFNQYCMFLIFSACALLIAILSCLLPESMNYKKNEV